MYKRINVTGNAGAGKSTLAELLGRRVDLPVYALDRIVWQPGWMATPPEQRRRMEMELIARETWIIDGVSSRVRAAADLVVFLDVPRSTSLFRCVKRNRSYLFRSRPGLPENCPEIVIMPRLLRLIWSFPRVVRPDIMEEAKRSTRTRYPHRAIERRSRSPRRGTRIK